MDRTSRSVVPLKEGGTWFLSRLVNRGGISGQWTAVDDKPEITSEYFASEIDAARPKIVMEDGSHMTKWH